MSPQVPPHYRYIPLAQMCLSFTYIWQLHCATVPLISRMGVVRSEARGSVYQYPKSENHIIPNCSMSGDESALYVQAESRCLLPIVTATITVARIIQGFCQ
jgi:hypothetical protein